ncbi:DM13 domain-containing protein [Pseudalkalibacillus sp. Hm43]|uniref:DM13 domain-containing protein n=1 Tax=Pseudalkalibacillus sp. Hm43 TaxID=3450742 RepID=UPI003F42F034
MKKVMIGVVAIVFLGVGWWLGSPLFLDKEVNEEAPQSVTEPANENESSATSDEEKQTDSEDAEPVEQMYSGTFVDADDKHKASGNVQTITTEEGTFLRFEQFEATNGPDLYVYLAEEGKPTKEGIELGKLKGNKGDQNYPLPKGADLSQFNTVVIWCKAFDEDFGYAALTLN